MHVHLDPVGGIAGDMFLAAIVDAWPDMESDIVDAMRRAGLPDSWQAEAVPGASAGITGKRFSIGSADHGHDPHPTGPFREIRALLQQADLEANIRTRALDMFSRLAEVESGIHGIPVDEVHFHELAAWDSIADIVGAAAAVETLNASWSIGALPLGSGTVQTAHGPLPVPAPATAHLLKGFMWIDDGIAGERVTPTGAVILAHLDVDPVSSRPRGRLAATGHGLGTRTMPGQANILRLMGFATERRGCIGAEEVGVIVFDVDDQTSEDLAEGISRLRMVEGVLDIVQAPVTGKKGRIAITVRVLCRPRHLDDVIEHCFMQTTTIGLRWRLENRATLARTDVTVKELPGKRVHRPDGTDTLKVEMDAIAREAPDQAARARLRRSLETVS